MNYFDQWNERLEDTSDTGRYNRYVQIYYDAEKQAYEHIFSAYPDHATLLSGTARDVADKLGYSALQMDLFLGFLDGINESLKKPLKLASIKDETKLALEIDFHKLYWNMLDAKASWLFGLKLWDKILSSEEQADIRKSFRDTKIIRVEKVGRNDPCPCGSEKKYKQCCMNK